MGGKRLLPSLAFERCLWDSGYCHVAGLDEVGRGAWAGPVVAAAVILPPNDPTLTVHLAGVRDSKALTAARRGALLEVIQRHALAWGVGSASPIEIDELGIVAATQKAMSLALHALSLTPDYLLIDHVLLPEVSYPQMSLPKGDACILSIAAASIVAKVGRDQLMIDLGARFPGYHFGRHKGYGTGLHQAALATLGPSALHRRSFAPVQRIMLQCDGPAALVDQECVR